jgi:hypothetical protein
VRAEQGRFNAGSKQVQRPEEPGQRVVLRAVILMGVESMAAARGDVVRQVVHIGDFITMQAELLQSGLVHSRLRFHGAEPPGEEPALELSKARELMEEVCFMEFAGIGEEINRCPAAHGGHQFPHRLDEGKDAGEGVEEFRTRDIAADEVERAGDEFLRREPAGFQVRRHPGEVSVDLRERARRAVRERLEGASVVESDEHVADVEEDGFGGHGQESWHGTGRIPGRIQEISLAADRAAAKLDASMTQPSGSPTPGSPSFSGWHRLVLAGAAAAALATLCWAGLQVRDARAEVHRLRQEPKPAPDADSSRPTEVERRLAESAAREKQHAADHAARVKELEGVIEFLRQENAAAQQTIERLSKLEAGVTREGGGQ